MSILQTNVWIPFVLAFACGAILGPVVIPMLLRLKVGQSIRSEGVQAHLKKAGTPTMGGIMFMIAILVGSIFFVGSNQRIIPVLVLTIGFGVIGFIDDYLKVVKHNTDGLLPKQKLLFQFLVATAFIGYLWVMDAECFQLRIPFTSIITENSLIKILAVPLCYFVILGTVNAVNFTDGLDGLASSVTAVVAFFVVLASGMVEAGIEPVAAATMGALLAFLLYNVYPAKVFMGDTGSLALGGFVVGSAYLMKMPLFIPIIGFIYFAEILSVMIQVTYFKKTGGKRIFKMTPIHHHFELCDWSETRIVTVFTTVTIFLCLLGLLAIR